MNKKGFTLIELMVVIVIIGILSSIAVPKMFGMTAKAKFIEIPMAIKSWENLQDVYIMERGYVGNSSDIGYVAPISKYNFEYLTDSIGVMSVTIKNNNVGDCVVGQTWTSMYINYEPKHLLPTDSKCSKYTPKF